MNRGCKGSLLGGLKAQNTVREQNTKAPSARGEKEELSLKVPLRRNYRERTKGRRRGWWTLLFGREGGGERTIEGGHAKQQGRTWCIMQSWGAEDEKKTEYRNTLMAIGKGKRKVLKLQS